MTESRKYLAGIAVVVLFLVSCKANKGRSGLLERGDEWMSWNTTERNRYVFGYLDGYLTARHTACDVDDIYYSPASHMLYVGAAKAAKLTIARADDKGKLSLIAQMPTRQGARNGVLDKNGNLYLAHSAIAKYSDLLVVSPNGK